MSYRQSTLYSGTDTIKEKVESCIEIKSTDTQTEKVCSSLTSALEGRTN